MPALATPRRLGFLDLEIARQHRAHACHGNFDAFGDIGSAAHDLNRVGFAHVYRDYVHVVGIGVLNAGQHVAHYNAGKGIARAFNAFDARARQVKACRKTPGCQ